MPSDSLKQSEPAIGPRAMPYSGPTDERAHRRDPFGLPGVETRRVRFAGGVRWHLPIPTIGFRYSPEHGYAVGARDGRISPLIARIVDHEEQTWEIIGDVYEVAAILLRDLYDLTDEQLESIIDFTPAILESWKDFVALRTFVVTGAYVGDADDSDPDADPGDDRDPKVSLDILD